jgi:hypothetical protein
VNLLLLLSAAFAAQGLGWVVVGSFDPWGLYDRWLAMALFGASELPAGALPLWRFGVALIGATTTGFFVLFFAVVRYGLSPSAPWAYPALWTALLCWFVPDSLASMALGVGFNVVAVNVPCVVLLGGTLAAWKRATTRQALER